MSIFVHEVLLESIVGFYNLVHADPTDVNQLSFAVAAGYLDRIEFNVSFITTQSTFSQILTPLFGIEFVTEHLSNLRFK